ncbi:hypothetical protein MKQ70_16525 [Chitinophaga sedimenti]|uniref:hypothetical protein n=1 Tax=Chitinophaga sedimenti TaxID=2033606 RepID=UPI0020050287|nr:hypothetical protein [Chitinophaga sedimenti]MCK7556534.1 hypothetical protein [Chitinophaga sedimenti]
MFTSGRKKHYGYYFHDLGERPLVYLDEFNLDRVNNNADQVFKNNLSAAKDEFLKLDRMYQNALQNRLLSGIWRFIEVLHKGLDANKKMSIISGAMLLGEQSFRKRRIYLYLQNAIHPINSSYQSLGITANEQSLYFRGGKSFRLLAKKINSDFFKLAHKELEARLTPSAIQQTRAYYYSILEELYEQRNLETHGTGQINLRAHVKLMETMPHIIYRYKWIIYANAKSYPSMTLPDIIQKIQQEVERNYGEYAAS